MERNLKKKLLIKKFPVLKLSFIKFNLLRNKYKRVTLKADSAALVQKRWVKMRRCRVAKPKRNPIHSILDPPSTAV